MLFYYSFIVLLGLTVFEMQKILFQFTEQQKTVKQLKKFGRSYPEVFCDTGFLKILKNSQESIYTVVSFYQSYRSPVFQISCEFFKKTFFVKHC